MSDLIPTDAVDAEVICGEKEARCHCVLAPRHEGPHACDPDTCGGSWTYDDAGRFQVVTLPHKGGAALPFSILFGGGPFGWGDDG